MSGLSKLPRLSSLQLLGALSLLFFTVDTPALTISPSPSYDGNYTVYWDTTLGYSWEDVYPCYPEHWYSLQEDGVDVAWSGNSLPLSGKSPGSYTYYVYYRTSVCGSPYDEYIVEGPVTVTVGTPPARDPLPTQLTYQYETRTGDIDSNGKTDIFVQRTSGGVAGNGTLEQVILLQGGSGGTFSILVPDSSQATTAAAWPTSSASVVVTDFNVDGFVDVEVKGVAAAAGVAGAFDQIVYSPGAPYQSQPLGLRAVDTSLKQFVANSLDYFVNPNYFDDHAALVYYTGYSWYFICLPAADLYGLIEGYYGGDWYCGIYYDYYSGYYWDYSALSKEAVALWANEEAYEQGSIGETASTQGAQEAAEEALEVEIGGWPMEEVLGENGEHTDANVRRGLEIFWAILGIGRANAQEVETEEAPAQVPREPGIIYLTSHKVAGIGGISLSLHAAVEYTSPYTVFKTISAYNSNGSQISGTLISEKNWKNDLFGNMTAGLVTPPGTMSDAQWVYWVQLMAAEDKYSNQNQPYNADPRVFGGGGYNSNGFIGGMLQATGGVSNPPVTPANGFRGGDYPVPAFAFH